MAISGYSVDLNPAVRVSDDPALSVDVRMTTAGIQSALVGKSYSTAVAAVLNVLMVMTTKHPDPNMRKGMADILRKTADRVCPAEWPLSALAELVEFYAASADPSDDSLKRHSAAADALLAKMPT